MLRFLMYEIVCWTLLAVVASAATPALAIVVAGIALYTTIPLLLFLRWRGWPFYPRAAFRLLVVRVALYAQLLLPIAAAAAAVGLLAGWPLGMPLLLGRVLTGAALSIAVLVLLGGYVGSKRLVVREVDARVPGLDDAFNGLRIVQISDLHVGPHTSRRFMTRVAETVARAMPDVIAVTGDVVDDRAEDVTCYAAIFSRLRAPLGVYLIPGNHDIYAGWEDVAQSLRQRTETTILVNESRVVERRGARLAIVGTGDPAAGSRRRPWGDSSAAPDVERALAEVPSATTVVAFAHNPALWPGLVEHGVALTLSGHTHWGQLALPRFGWSIASPFMQYAMGAHRAGDSLLYINPGTGYWGIPFRIGAYPEITVVTLRPADEAEISVGEARLAA